MAVMTPEHWRPEELLGRLVNLRRHRERNLPHVTRWYRDPELARLTRYQTRPMTIEEIERFFHSRLMSDEAIAYAIHEATTDRLIGLTTFSALDATTARCSSTSPSASTTRGARATGRRRPS